MGVANGMDEAGTTTWAVALAAQPPGCAARVRPSGRWQSRQHARRCVGAQHHPGGRCGVDAAEVGDDEVVRHPDLEAVRRLWDLWQSESPAPPAWADASWDANRAEFERALGANGLFLAEEDGEVVGFVSSWLEEHVARIGDL